MLYPLLAGAVYVCQRLIMMMYYSRRDLFVYYGLSSKSVMVLVAYISTCIFFSESVTWLKHPIHLSLSCHNQTSALIFNQRFRKRVFHSDFANPVLYFLPECILLWEVSLVRQLSRWDANLPLYISMCGILGYKNGVKSFIVSGPFWSLTRKRVGGGVHNINPHLTAFFTVL